MLPVVVLIFCCIMGMVYTGGFFDGESFIDAFAGSDASMGLVLGSVITLILTFIYYMIRRVMTFQEFTECIPDGFKQMVPAILILTFAWTLSGMTGLLGGATFVENLVANAAPGMKAMLPAIVFLVCVGLAFATGTSWGTFAACAPIFLWLNHIVGGNILLTIGAIAGGSCFGDNIGLISDTTIVSSGIQQVEVIKRVRHQGVWSLLCLVSGAIVFYVASLGFSGEAAQAADAISQIPADVWQKLGEERPSAVTLLELVKTGVPYYMVIPLIIVIATAVMGYSTLICLGSGIFFSLVFGLISGTVTSLNAFFEVVYTGFSDAGGWSIAMMLWVGAFGGVMRKMNAFDPIAVLIARMVHKVRHLMFANSVLCLLGNAALSDEMAQIVTIGPIIKNITEENVVGSKEDMYTLALRNATFSDAMGVLGSQLIPWHCYMGFFLGISASVYPLASGITAGDIISHNYFSMIAVASMLILTFTGWDRYIPLFKLPTEPKVYLKSEAAQFEGKE